MKNTANMVEMPIGTVKALKKMLFNSENGVDLSAIIADVAEPENEDLTAINVALVYKGLSPEIDTNPRYTHWGENKCTKYTFVHYSLIRDIVFCSETECSIAGGQLVEGRTYSNLREMPLKQWLNMATEPKTE